MLIKIPVTPSVWTGRVAIRALFGTVVSLQCTAEAYPVPQTFWVLNGEQRLVNGMYLLALLTYIYNQKLYE